MKKMLAMILVGSLCISSFVGVSASEPAAFTRYDRTFVEWISSEWGNTWNLKMKKAYLNDEKDYFLYKQRKDEVLLCDWVNDGKQELLVPDKIDGKTVKKVVLYGVGAKTVTLADGVEKLDCYIEKNKKTGFTYGKDALKKIKYLNLGKSFKQKNMAFSAGALPKLKEVNVSAKNKKYTAVDGVMFSKNKEKLVLYPAAKKGTYTVAKSITHIGKGAFKGSKLKKIVIRGRKTTLNKKCGISVKIVAPYGSNAHTFATNNKLKFKALK